MTDGTTPEDIQAALEKRYADEPFVRILPFGVTRRPVMCAVRTMS